MEKGVDRSNLEGKYDDELIEILYFDKGEYNYASIQEVKKIIAERKISVDFIKKTKAQIRKRRRRENLLKQKENSRFFLVDILIDVILSVLSFFK